MLYTKIQNISDISYSYLEYPFAKYNVQPPTYTYSQDEYTRFLEGEIILTNGQSAGIYIYSSISADKEWTKDETDYLFSVVRDFDLRWYIIHDRYEYPESPSRSIEVLHSTTVSVYLSTYALFRTSKIVTTAFVVNWYEIVPGQAMKQPKLN